MPTIGSINSHRRRTVAAVVVVGLIVLTATASSGEHVTGNRVLVIGDSLLEFSEPSVQSSLNSDGWQAVVIGHRGYSIEDWQQLIEPLAAFVRPNVAVVELGTNDCNVTCPDLAPVIDATMRTLVANDVGAVLWLNVQERPDYPAHARYVNLAIAQAAIRWPQMEVVDLRRFADPHPEWHDPDGLHFNSVGQQALGALIRLALHRWTPAGKSAPSS
jgi:lysophospholipase L1-like esterase